MPRLCTALLTGLAAATAGCGGGPEPPRINLLLITIDTLRADHLGIYGYERPTSPAIDAFAERSIVFDRAQACTSWTLPGLAAILTSHYTSTTGTWRFNDALDSSFHTLAETLRDAGYDTAAVASHVFLGSDHGLPQGFTHFDDELVHSVRASHQQITSPAVSDKGIRFLERKAAVPGEGPWFLWLHYFDPHEEYLPHPGLSERFGTEAARDLYDGEIAFTDLHVGRVLEALEELGQAGETLVILVSDHGEEFGDHGKNGHGLTLFGEVVRVPLLVRAPGFEPRRVGAVVRTVDLFPTVCELVGVEPVRPLAGASLVARMDGRVDAERPALLELRLDPDAHRDGLVEGEWKLLVDPETSAARLYRLSEDPGEQRDLAAEFPERVDRMRHTLEGLRERAAQEARAYGSAERLNLLPGVAEGLGDLGYGDGDQP